MYTVSIGNSPVYNIMLYMYINLHHAYTHTDLGNQSVAKVGAMIASHKQIIFLQIVVMINVGLALADRALGVHISYFYLTNCLHLHVLN